MPEPQRKILRKKNSKGKILPYFDKGVYRKYDNGALIHRGRLRNWIRFGFEKSAYKHVVDIPFFGDPIAEVKGNKNKANTYHVYDLDCRQYCIYADKCVYAYRRLRNGRAVACYNFKGKHINLEVCTKCKGVRYIESPVKLEVVCLKCRGKETEDKRENPKIFHNKNTELMYQFAKQKRMKELRDE